MNFPDKMILPEFNGKSGHPPLIPARLIPDILDLDDHSNLGILLRSRKKDQRKQIVHDRGILLDADTKESYEVLKKKYQSLDIPDRQECVSIINTALKGEDSIKAHLETVSETALALTQAIQENQVKNNALNSEPSLKLSPSLDINLILAGALLHDIKRKERDHTTAGKKFISSLGFPKVADIVASHMDLNLPLSDQLTEAQVVYFADKLSNGPLIELDYTRRFNEKIKKTPNAKTTILRRYDHTRHIQARIEKISGRSVRSILY